MTTRTGAGHLRVIYTGGRNGYPRIDGCVAGFANVGSGEMCCTLARGAHAIVTTNARLRTNSGVIKG